jgi:hypothetical protein
MPEEITAKCRRCGQSVPVRSLVLDNVYNMVVCPMCIKERKLSDQVRKPEKEAKDEKIRDSGIIQKEQQRIGRAMGDGYVKLDVNKIEDIPKPIQRPAELNPDKIKLKCGKCHYGFTYNQEAKQPSSCPYCGAGIDRASYA